jgi:putative aldouronate transport system substrate-binding protein
MFAKWGIEGTTYTGKISDGTFKLAPTVNWGGLNPSGTKSLQVDYGFFNGVFVYGGSDQLLNSQFPAAEQEFQKLMNARKPRELAPPAPLTTEEREQASLWETGLHDYVNQNTLKFALGQRPLSEWDAFQTELKGKNVDQYIEVINKAYDRYKQANP